MDILTAAEMGETDRRTVDEFGVKLDELMERAGEAVARFCLRHFAAAGRVVVLCGKGNNGGDGLVAARHLAAGGRSVRVVLLGEESEFKGPARTAVGRLRAEAAGVEVETLSSEGFDGQMAKALGWAELIVDAVVGTGFKPPLRGVAEQLREKVKESKVPVVAVDVSSGWDADSMEQTSEGAFRADAVVTFTAPKTAHIFGHLTQGSLDGGAFGPVVVAEIGSPREAVVAATGRRWAGAAKAIAERPRAVNSNKGRFGHVLVVGGSYGKAGAAMMASLAALRTGAGLVTAAVPKSIVNTVAAVAPELMMLPLAEDEEGAISFKNQRGEKLDQLLKKISVLAVGPGLSTDGDAPEFARQMVEKTTQPMVIDADALNAFEGREKLLNGEGRVMVLTPHPGEMARLVGLTVKEVEADRVNLARDFAMEHKLTLVLKGWRTLVAHPDGTIGVNTSGNPAMAKGGSGDILTGIVAAMVAQYPEDIARAVEAAVYLHGLAGDLAARALDQHTVLATDTVAYLSEAFRYRVKDADGFTWICGLNRSGSSR
ncbi:NAD(P)H-hydrate dehydratase [Granulicella sp. dw_53]|uniref:NAD(P)H-hydrate dehydratase n=1 Tax=Granulicella sp. dw_53 TaxID=2719792 RepID=UPI001BD3F5E1|nr:NAD(P)H-hydrate dehydratase [Granulicella sp. dw_53]